MLSKLATQRPTLMQTGRITTNKPLNKLVEAGKEGGHVVHDEKKAADM